MLQNLASNYKSYSAQYMEYKITPVIKAYRVLFSHLYDLFFENK